MEVQIHEYPTIITTDTRLNLHCPNPLTVFILKSKSGQAATQIPSWYCERGKNVGNYVFVGGHLLLRTEYQRNIVTTSSQNWIRAGFENECSNIRKPFPTIIRILLDYSYPLVTSLDGNPFLADF